MPLIVDRENEKKWVSPGIKIEEIKNLIAPFNENKMHAYTVSDMVNSARNKRNVEEAIKKEEYTELD